MASHTAIADLGNTLVTLLRERIGDPEVRVTNADYDATRTQSGYYVLVVLPTHSATVDLRVEADAYLTAARTVAHGSLPADDPLVEIDRSLAAADAYGDVSHERFLEVSDAAIQSMLEDAVDENLITAEDGRIVLEESNYLHFQPDRFEIDWDLTNHDSITLGGDRY